MMAGSNHAKSYIFEEKNLKTIRIKGQGEKTLEKEEAG
jgi:hypothetical protein